MSWVSIDQDKCNDCGICILRCMSCFSKKGDEVFAQADTANCNICGHCVALCPTGAVVHHKMDMENFIKIDKDVNFETDKFIQFIRRRRSHRYFKNKAIPREDMEKLIDTCRYAPTGSNVQTVEIIVIQNSEKIKKLSDLTIDFFEDMGTDIEKQVDQLKSENRTIPENLQKMVTYKSRLVMARQAGINPIFYNAPAVIVFHSPANTSTPKDNCVIASTTMTLTAMTMGLESTYIGLFEAAAIGYPSVNEELQLPDGHNVYSVLIMGYPGFKFLRGIDRFPVKTRWE